MKNALLKAALLSAILLALHSPAVQAQTLNFAQSPLFLGSSVNPNVLVIYDNSQSMDGTMAGKLIPGDDPSTRGNIARAVLRSTITTYRNAFQWGLASFNLKNKSVYTTYAYYFGGNGEVVYTNDCVNGISVSNGGLRCIANPQTGNGSQFITYRYTGDDPAINDVLYAGDFGTQLYGIGVNNSTKYAVYGSHGAGTNWTAGEFSSGKGTWTFTPTDAGYLPNTPPNNRMFWLRRAWGYYGDIKGDGVINRGVQADSTTHYNTLMALLAPETGNNSTTELKNAAVFTPLAGTLGTAWNYFKDNISSARSPIVESCQKNFVLLATDGNPTGKTDGNMYNSNDLDNVFNAATGTWTYSTAAKDVFDKITGLRVTRFNSKDYDVKTYVVGLGDSVANASSVAGLNRMAELGGTTAAYLASDQQALADAFQTISTDIISQTAAATAVSLNAGSWNSGSKVYQGRFSSADWSGQLLAYPVTATGEPGSTSDWDAAKKLNSQHWSTGRQILTYKPSGALGSRGVPFRWPANAASPGAAEIDAGLVTALNKNGVGVTDNFGAQRLEFLRGNTTRELRNCSSCSAPVFRNRASSVLGDIINSAPVYVGGAMGEYRDTIASARYSSYATARGSQVPMLYAGANDGMLHGFDAVTGNEVFAYVPWAVRSKLSTLTANPYTHLFTVDGSPSVGDVFFSSGWKTMLVAGMNAGAPGLYALDITNPANFTEAKAADVVRWEIGDSDTDVGYIFGRPILTKMTDGRWRAIVGNGYNSARGRAVLLMIDLETGAITRLDTGSGSAGSPNGLSGVAVVSSADNDVADTVYAGDLYGNVWKFDLTATTPAGWKVAYGTAGAPLPLFTTASGQAITARPDVTRFPKGGYLVAVGSGRYVDIADNGTTTTQSLYGIWDNGEPVAMSALQTQNVVRTGTGGDGRTYRLTTHAVGAPSDTALSGDNAISLANYFSNRKGWRINLPTSGERVVTDAAVRSGRITISTLIPSAAACSFGGDGWVMDVDAITGNRTAALDTDGDNIVNTNDHIGGTMVSGLQVGAVPAAATVIRGTGDLKKTEFKLINTSNGKIVRVPNAASTLTSRRAAWEQLQ